MKRRAYLSVVTAASIGVAGCSSFSGGGSPNEATSTTANTPERRTTPSTESVDAVEITGETLSIYSSGDAPTAIIEAVIENTSDTALYDVEVVAEFFDSADQSIGTVENSMIGLQPGEQWQVYLPIQSETAIESGSISAPRAAKVDRNTLDTGGDVYEVRNTSFEQLAEDPIHPRFTGTIEKTGASTSTRVRVVALAYDAGGVVLETASEVLQMYEGDQSEFEAVFDMWTEQRADAIDTTDYLLYYS